MKEIQEILKKIKTLKADEKAILATVVDVQGSSYRLPGAKMLILENGETFGTVSGGCLEADVLERAKQVLETGEPQVFIYDTTNDLDSVFSLNMGCRGIIRILLEVVENNKYVEFIQNCYEKHFIGVSAVVINYNEKTEIGKRIFYDENANIHNHLNSEHTEQITDTFKELNKAKTPLLKTFDFGEVFFDYISLPVHLTIFGAGADAIPLAEIAKNLGWRITVVDHREAFANKERFINADEIVISHPNNIEKDIKFDENSVVVVMTHNYNYDKQILRALLKSDVKYIGKLGPKRRSENILREFQEEELEYTEQDLEKLYSPVGLDIGADTPEAIALSIIAEIQAVLKDRSGGNLRNRKGSIYGRDE